MRCSAFLILLCVSASPALAQLDLRAPIERQERIRAQTREVATALETLLADFAANNLSDTPEAELIRTLSAALDRLSEDEIARVLTAMREYAVIDAHRGQQQALASFRQILADFQKQQDLAALVARFEALVERQRRAMVATVETSRQPLSHQETGRVIAQQAADQTLLTAEAADALAAVGGLAVQASAEDAVRLTAATRLAAEKSLLSAMQGASADLATHRVFRAGLAQQAARDTLRAIVAALSPEPTRVQQLQAAIEELDSQLGAQASVAAPGQDAATAARLQGDLLDRATLAQRDVAPLASETKAPMESAMAAMSSARNKLVIQNDSPARDIAAARNSLQEARSALSAELARESPAAASSPPKAGEQAAAASAEAAEAIDKAITEQAAAAQAASDAAAQPDATKKRADLERAASAQTQAQARAAGAERSTAKASAAAAETLALAQQAMARAQRRLQSGEAAPAGAEQQRAADALREARRALARSEDTAAAQQQASAATDSARKGGDALKQGQSGKAAEEFAGSAAALEGAAARTAAGAGGKALESAAASLRGAASAARAGDPGRAEGASAAAQAQLLAAAGELAKAAEKVAAANANPTAPGQHANTPAQTGEAPDGSSAFLGLPARDRKALEQSQSEIVPPDYAPLVEGYRRSLALEGAPR